jgi:hypothetical protein
MTSSTASVRVCDRLRAFLDVVCSSFGCVAKVVCAFAHVFGD